jgi:hypothetical protein
MMICFAQDARAIRRELRLEMRRAHHGDEDSDEYITELILSQEAKKNRKARVILKKLDR